MEAEGGAAEGKCAANRLADAAVSASLLEALLKATDEGVMVFDATGKIVALNERAHKLSGCPQEFRSTPNENVHDTPAELFELLSVDGLMLPIDDWPIARVLRGETILRLHLRIRRHDSKTSWIGVFNGIPVFDNHSRVAFGILTMRDFSDRTETEQALAETNLRLTELLESITDAFVSYDSQWRYAYVNEPAAQILGRSRQEVIGLNMWDMVPDDVSAPFRGGFDRCMDTRQAVEFEAPFKTHGLQLLCRCFPTRDGGVSVYFVDVTERVKAEEALRESEDRFRSMADNIPQLAWMADEKGNIFWYNKRWSDFTGMSLEEMQQDGWREVHHPDHIERVIRKLTHSFKTGVPWEDNFPMCGKSGQYRWFLSRATPIRDELGRIVRWFGTATDVTEQKRTQEALTESEQRLRLSQQIARVGTFEWNIPQDTIVWSPELEALYGLSPGGFDGTINSWINCIHPEDKTLARRCISEAFGSGSLKGEWRVIRPDGAVRWLEARGWVFKGAGGQPKRMLGVNLEITARKRAEEELQRHTEHRRLALEFGQTGTWEYDPINDSVYCDALACKILGSEECDTDYHSFLEIIHPDDRQATHQAIEAALASKDNGEYEIEHRVTHADGRVRWLLSRGRGIFADSEGVRRAQRLVGTLVDITDRREWTERLERITAELRRSNEDLQQFAYVASHDLQEPLRMVAGFVQLLGDRYRDQLDEKANQYIAFAVDGANRMRQLIDDLLAYSHVDRRGRKLVLTSAQVALDTALANMLSTIEQTHAQITHDPLPTVNGDNTQLAQLFQNLIGNGLKFRRHNVTPEIHIVVERSNDHWRFSVSDNGIGIPENQRERVFAIFQRLHTSSEYPGTGIGLAICRKIVERHGGNIWLKSEPGEGTTFYFTLPVAEDAS